MTGLLKALTSVVGEAIDELRGHLLTRLTAQSRPEEQLARGTGSLSSTDGVNVTLSAGAFGPRVVRGTFLRLLSGANAGAAAEIQIVVGPAAVTVAAPGLPAPFTDLSWEAVRSADTEIQVESTLYFSDEGELFLGGIRYRYSGRTASSFTSLSHWNGESWISGVATMQESLDVVADYTRNRTALDRLRRSFFVEFAEGEDLSVIGANHGRPRWEALADDELYRAYLRAAMFAPWGTRLCLEQILDAVVGVGRWEIFEDFTSASDDYARIFVRRTDEDPTELHGKAILDGDVIVPALTPTRFELPDLPLRISSVTLAPDSSERIVAVGSGAMTADGETIMAPAGSFPARILRGDRLEVLDGPRAGERGRIAQNVSSSELALGFVRGFANGALSGPSSRFGFRVVRELTDCRFAQPSRDVALEFDGDPGTQAWAWVGAVPEAQGSIVVGSADPIFGDRTAIGSPTPGFVGFYRHVARIAPESRATFELFCAPATSTVLSPADGRQAFLEIRDGERAISAGFFFVDGRRDGIALIDSNTGVPLTPIIPLVITAAAYRHVVLEKVGTKAAALLVNGHIVATLPHASFAPAVDRTLQFGCRSPSNAFNNVRSIAWWIETETDLWSARTSTASTPGSGSRDIMSLPFVNAADAGKVVSVRRGSARNAAGGSANGEWIVEAVLGGGRVTVIGRTRSGATFRRGHPNVIFVPEEFALDFPDSLGHAIEILAGPHAGTYPIVRLLDAAFRDLNGREDGSALDSLLINADGDPAIRDRSSVVEVGGAPSRGFTATDGEFEWRLVPVFPADTNLYAQLSDAGGFFGRNGILRQPLPSPLPLLSVSYSRVLSAHTEALEVRNRPPPERWPFYLHDAWGLLRPVIVDGAAEGITVELDSLERDASGLHIVEE